MTVIQMPFDSVFYFLWAIASLLLTTAVFLHLGNKIFGKIKFIGTGKAWQFVFAIIIFLVSDLFVYLISMGILFELFLLLYFMLPAIWLFVIGWVVLLALFAVSGYFIYKFARSNLLGKKRRVFQVLLAIAAVEFVIRVVYLAFFATLALQNNYLTGFMQAKYIIDLFPQPSFQVLEFLSYIIVGLIVVLFVSVFLFILKKYGDGFKAKLRLLALPLIFILALIISIVCVWVIGSLVSYSTLYGIANKHYYIYLLLLVLLSAFLFSAKMGLVDLKINQYSKV
jgi:hypothetical protein